MEKKIEYQEAKPNNKGIVRYAVVNGNREVKIEKLSNDKLLLHGFDRSAQRYLPFDSCSNMPEAEQAIQAYANSYLTKFD